MSCSDSFVLCLRLLLANFRNAVAASAVAIVQLKEVGAVLQVAQIEVKLPFGDGFLFHQTARQIIDSDDVDGLF